MELVTNEHKIVIQQQTMNDFSRFEKMVLVKIYNPDKLMYWMRLDVVQGTLRYYDSTATVRGNKQIANTLKNGLLDIFNLVPFTDINNIPEYSYLTLQLEEVNQLLLSVEYL